MANDDKVYLAYSGALGEDFQKSTRNRVDWIIEQAGDAKEILDIGCSQGIVSLLLGERADSVLGIDIQPEAIEFAEQIKNEEYAHVKDKVTFQCVDFMKYETDRKYDCIIITEVLEHLQNPQEFVAKAASLLKPKGGKLVVSVPFGINDHPDHYSTFYLSNFYELIHGSLKVAKVFFMERWIGAAAYPFEADREEYLLDIESMRELEENFLKIDRKMTDRVMTLYKQLMEANNKYRTLTTNYAKLKNDIQQQQLNVVKDYDKTIRVMEEMKRKMQKLEVQNSILMQQNYENRKKLDMIENNPIGKVGIKAYKQYKKIRRRLK